VHVGLALLTLFPGRVGGSESNVRGLLAEFSQGQGPERVTVLANRHVARAYAGWADGRIAIRQVRSYRAGNRNTTRLLAMVAAALTPRLVARDVPKSFDVLHHAVTVPIPSLPGTPTVTTVYDLQHHDLPQLFSRSERAFRRWAYDRAARAADLTLTTSDYSRDRLAAVLSIDPGRIVAIPMGIDHERFQPTPTKADERIAPRVPERFVLFPANLWAHKNHARLIEAFGAVKDRELELVLTGQTYGREGELREAAARAGVAKRVHHLGHVAPDELPALMRAARALVFPSLYEGFGSPPLEAMACGCPVASSRKASLDQMVGEAALALDPDSVDSIADAIDRVTSDLELVSGLRERGIRHAGGFTWQACAERHRAAYERVAETRGLPRGSNSR
jgi:glycosyltransferase involved in cell wall biosynthesis